MALLPQELGRTKKWAGHLLPAQHVAPLVYEDGQVAVALDPVPVKVADDALGGRADIKNLFELFASSYRYPGELGVEAFDVLGLFFEVALGDEEGEVGVLVAGYLEAPIQVALDAFPDREPVRTNSESPPYRPVICELGHPDQLQVPPARILALFRKLLYRLDHERLLSRCEPSLDESIAFGTAIKSQAPGMLYPPGDTRQWFATTRPPLFVLLSPPKQGQYLSGILSSRARRTPLQGGARGCERPPPPFAPLPDPPQRLLSLAPPAWSASRRSR